MKYCKLFLLFRECKKKEEKLQNLPIDLIFGAGNSSLTHESKCSLGFTGSVSVDVVNKWRVVVHLVVPNSTITLKQSW